MRLRKLQFLHKLIDGFFKINRHSKKFDVPQKTKIYCQNSFMHSWDLLKYISLYTLTYETNEH